MKLIPLNSRKGIKRFAIVDDEDYERMVKFKWYYNGGYVKRAAYIKREPSSGKSVRLNLMMHNEIKPPRPGFEIDHEDGNTLNNRRENLRQATHQQNGFNQRIQAQRGRVKSSRFKGVYYIRRLNKFGAQIVLSQNGIKRKTYLGIYAVEEDAARAYNREARVMFGRFARLNPV